MIKIGNYNDYVKRVSVSRIYYRQAVLYLSNNQYAYAYEDMRKALRLKYARFDFVLHEYVNYKKIIYADISHKRVLQELLYVCEKNDFAEMLEVVKNEIGT